MPQGGKFAALRRVADPMPGPRPTGCPGYIPGAALQLYLLLAAPQACVAKASISTSSVPQGRLRCVPDERVPGRQGVRVARLRESQSARSCCRCRSGFSCRRIRACNGQENRAGTERNKDRKSVVWGKSVSVRVDLGGRRTIKKKNNKNKHTTIK